MTKIVKIHGCSGAGKTTVARGIMRECKVIDTERNEKGKPLYYQLYHPSVTQPIILIGSYENTCGGVDTIPEVQTVLDFIDQLHPTAHIILEGLLISTYYGKMGEHSKRFGQDYIYSFLTTPVDVCLDRIYQRRADSGRNNKFNPQLTIDKWNTIASLKNKVRTMGHRVEELDWTRDDLSKQVISWLE